LEEPKKEDSENDVIQQVQQSGYYSEFWRLDNISLQSHNELKTVAKHLDNRVQRNSRRNPKMRKATRTTRPSAARKCTAGGLGLLI
jgi:hypothetical protein